MQPLHVTQVRGCATLRRQVCACGFDRLAELEDPLELIAVLLDQAPKLCVTDPGPPHEQASSSAALDLYEPFIDQDGHGLADRGPGHSEEFRE